MDTKVLLPIIGITAYRVGATVLNRRLTPTVPGCLQIFYADNSECIFNLHVTPNGQRCPVKEITKRLNQRARCLATMQGKADCLTLSSDSDRKFAGAVHTADFVFMYSSGTEAPAFADEAFLLTTLMKARGVLSKEEMLATQQRLTLDSPTYNEHLHQLFSASRW